MKRTLYTLLATVAIALGYVFIISLSQDSEFTANFKLEDYLLYSPDRDSILQTGVYGTYVLDRSGRNLIVPILNIKNKTVDIVTISLENKAAVKLLANIGIPELNLDLTDDSFVSDIYGLPQSEEYLVFVSLDRVSVANYAYILRGKILNKYRVYEIDSGQNVCQSDNSEHPTIYTVNRPGDGINLLLVNSNSPINKSDLLACNLKVEKLPKLKSEPAEFANRKKDYQKIYMETYRGYCFEVDLDSDPDCKLTVKYYSKEMKFHIRSRKGNKYFRQIITPSRELIFVRDRRIYLLPPEDIQPKLNAEK